MKTTAKTAQNEQKPVSVANFSKRIGSVTYEVSVRFSEGGNETMEDKLLRLVKREVGEVA